MTTPEPTCDSCGMYPREALTPQVETGRTSMICEDCQARYLADEAEAQAWSDETFGPGGSLDDPVPDWYIRAHPEFYGGADES